MASVNGSVCFGTECPTLSDKTEGQNLATRPEAEGRTREPWDPTRDHGRSSETAERREGGCVRNLAYLALTENDQSSEEAEYVRCATWSNPRGVSSIRVSSRRLVVPPSEHRCEGTPLFFSAFGGCALES